MNEIYHCRLCNGTHLTEIYQMDDVPVAGIYYEQNNNKTVSLPLTVLLCDKCGLVQLKEIIDDSIYKEYHFVGNSAGSYREYLEGLAHDLLQHWGIEQKSILEIGASNGVLLKFLHEKGDNQVFGVEPSRKLCEDARAQGITIHEGYFNEDYVELLGDAKFDCIIIRHVLEHVASLNKMIELTTKVLKEKGLLMIELPDIEQILENRIYTNFFHEHINYFSDKTLNQLLSLYGYTNICKKEVNIHGGAIFSIFQTENKSNFKELDSVISNRKRLVEFFAEAKLYYKDIHVKIDTYLKSGKTVHGFGASHRTFVYLSNLNLTEGNIPIIYDSNKMLQGKYLNGQNSLIIAPQEILKYNPDAIIIFASSFKEEIMKFLTEELQYKGDIILS